MEISLTNIPGVNSTVDKVKISDAIFGVDFKEALIHQVVTAYRAYARSGTRAQKTRSEVRGGGAKPRRQKGTGRSRAGTIRSPLWRGGGVTFAAKPVNHSQKINKKMFRAAMRSIFSELIRQGRLIVVEKFDVEDNKTKNLLKKLRSIDLTNVLIIAEEINKNLYLAARNLHKVDARDMKGIDPVSLIKFEKVMLTMAAIKKIEESLG